MQQTALERGRAFRALPYPVLVLVLRELIEVEEDVPARRGMGVIGNSGAPPDALGMLRVLPEVESVVVLEIAVGNAVGGVHHLENGVVVLLIARIRLEDRRGSRVLRLDPLERLRAVDVLEPQIR